MNFLRTSIFLAAVGLLVSCNFAGNQGTHNSSPGPSKPGGSSPSGNGQTFTAQVNGQPFTGKNIRATVTAIAGKPFFNITAFSHDLNYQGPNQKESIGFNIEGGLKTGDFTFGQNGKPDLGHSHGAYNAGSPENDIPPETVYGITGGKLTITKYDTRSKTASGTFEITTVNQEGKTIKIENGQFSDIAF